MRSDGLIAGATGAPPTAGATGTALAATNQMNAQALQMLNVLTARVAHKEQLAATRRLKSSQQQRAKEFGKSGFSFGPTATAAQTSASARAKALSLSLKAPGVAGSVSGGIGGGDVGAVSHRTGRSSILVPDDVHRSLFAHPESQAMAADFPLAEPSAYRQFMADSEDPSTEATIEQPYINFGSCSAIRTPPPVSATAAVRTASIQPLSPHSQIVSITNRTGGKLLAMWDTAEYDPTGDGTTVMDNGAVNGAPPLFVVTPPFADVLPYSTTQFTVTFHPQRDNSYYAQRLEVYCFHKINRSFRLVNENTHTPPLCLHTVVFGHTFASGAQQFLPNAFFTVPRTGTEYDFLSQALTLTRAKQAAAAADQKRAAGTASTGKRDPMASGGAATKSNGSFDALSAATAASLAAPVTATVVPLQFPPCRLFDPTTQSPDDAKAGGASLVPIAGSRSVEDTPRGQRVFETVALVNQGDTPLLFQFKQTVSADGVFRIKPCAGLIPRNATQLFCVEFAPYIASPYQSQQLLSGASASAVATSGIASSIEFKHSFLCTVNNSTLDAIPLPVWGMGWLPQLTAPNKMIFFRPTCKGLLSRKHVILHNPTRIPVVCVWVWVWVCSCVSSVTNCYCFWFGVVCSRFDV